MKHKVKRLEYDRQYKTMSVKEWREVFSDEKKFNLDGLDGFHKYWQAKHFQKRITKHNGGGSLMIREAFSSSGKLKLQFVN